MALVSCMMGGIAVVSSMLVLQISLGQMAGDSRLAKPLEFGQVITVMYLQVSVTDILTVFCARTTGPV